MSWLEGALLFATIFCYLLALFEGERREWSTAILAYIAGSLALFAILIMRGLSSGILGGN